MAWLTVRFFWNLGRHSRVRENPAVDVELLFVNSILELKIHPAVSAEVVRKKYIRR
jgi:hypothetical protein